MRSICESCFNKCETISFMQCLASVSSGLMNYHSWVTQYHQKESLWTRQGERCVGLEAAKVCAPSVKLFWFGRLLLKVHSELLQDFKAYHRALEEG
jgi:hypothetical protein